MLQDLAVQKSQANSNTGARCTATTKDLAVQKSQANSNWTNTLRVAGVDLGSGLVDQSQKMTVAARAMADKKTVGHLS